MEETAEASAVARPEGVYVESELSRGQPGLHTKTLSKHRVVMTTGSIQFLVRYWYLRLRRGGGSEDGHYTWISVS